MAHNLVYFDTSTNSIQKFSNAQIDDLAERVLRVMAAGTYTGTITVGSTNPIGTFTDTYYNQAAGTNSDLPITSGSTIYTLSQVQTATLGASSNAPMYVGLNTTDPTTTVLQENLTTREQLADEILSRMVSGTGGTNAYYLSASAPADGATWVSRGTLLDTKTAGTITITDYKLWQRTTSGATITSKNPMKITSDPLQSFSDAELEALIKTIEERIVATGVGLYAFQSTTPTPGTWTNVGSVIDTKENLTSTNYFGTAHYSQTYDATYIGPGQFFAWAGPGSVYTPLSYDSANVYDAEYANATALFDGAVFDALTGIEGPTYSTLYAHGYTQPYTNTYEASFNATLFPASYLGAPINALAYAGPGGTYNGPTPYYPDYIGTYDTTYTKFYSNAYNGAPNYTLTYFPSYTVTYVGAYTQSYVLSYLNTFATYYIGADGTEFWGPTFALTYTNENAITYNLSLIDSTTSSVGTTTLWRRIA